MGRMKPAQYLGTSVPRQKEGKKTGKEYQKAYKQGQQGVKGRPYYFIIIIRLYSKIISKYMVNNIPRNSKSTKDCWDKKKYICRNDP